MMPTLLFAQEGLVPIQHYFTLQYERKNSDSAYTPLTLKPFLSTQPLTSSCIDSARLIGGVWFRKMQSTGWLNYDYRQFSLHINPLMHVSIGKELGVKNIYNNIRGIQAYGFLSKKIFYQTTYYESQSVFPNYLSEFIADTGIVPGQGRVKGLINKKSFDYGWAESSISYKPNEFVDVAFGHNRNFIGFGYRSMLLSDNAIPYLNARINLHFKRIHYTSIYATLNNFQRGPVLNQGYEKKYFAAHYLNFFLHKRIELGLFETVVWPNADSSGYRGFEWNYLNPIIFYHATQNYLGSPDNSIIAANLRYQAFSNFHLYGQFVLDDLDIGRSKQNKGFYRNKSAFQLGIKWIDVLKLKGLTCRLEMNQAKPYTYTHKIPAQSYTAMQQPLAHPLGANFREYLSMVYYEHKRFSFDLSIIYAQTGIDTSNIPYGQNIFISDYLIPGFPKSYNNELLQGLKTSIFNIGLTVRYLLLPINRTCLELSLQRRELMNSKSGVLEANFVSFGLRTSLFNSYYDF
jgi:hypothetical protein